MKQIEVKIMGQSYLLGCPEDGEENLRLAVEKVDTAMCAIRDHGKIRARDRIAVLAALNLAVDLLERERATPGVPQPAPASAGLQPASVPASSMAPPSDLRSPAPQAWSAHNEPHLELLLTKLDQALGESTQAGQV